MTIVRRASFASVLLMGAAAPAVAGGDEGPFVGALRLVQRFGTAENTAPARDAAVKGILAKGMAKDRTFGGSAVAGLFDPAVFARLAGPDGRLDASEIRTHLEGSMPESRSRLLPRVAAHLDRLATSFDRIDPPHREAGARLADWIAANYRPGQPLHVTVICTGNSRRSILGSMMGNAAAAYCGMPEIRFHSGGTAPSAFNPRTIAALKAIGVEVQPTGAEAPRGEPDAANPVYTVRWGEGDMTASEFSKTYFDPANPQSGFAAILVCGEADAGCPVVKGAAVRIAMPYLDPKIFDGSPYEAEKYAERRDDIACLLLNVMTQVRNRVSAEAAPPRVEAQKSTTRR